MSRLNEAILRRFYRYSLDFEGRRGGRGFTRVLEMSPTPRGRSALLFGKHGVLGRRLQLSPLSSAGLLA